MRDSKSINLLKLFVNLNKLNNITIISPSSQTITPLYLSGHIEIAVLKFLYFLSASCCERNALQRRQGFYLTREFQML